MTRRPPRSTRTDTLVPDATLLRSDQAPVDRAAGRGRGADAVGDDAAAPPARRRRAVRAFADVRDDVSGAPADPGERPRPAALGGGAELGPAPPRQSGDRDRASDRPDGAGGGTGAARRFGLGDEA